MNSTKYREGAVARFGHKKDYRRCLAHGVEDLHTHEYVLGLEDVFMTLKRRQRRESHIDSDSDSEEGKPLPPSSVAKSSFGPLLVVFPRCARPCMPCELVQDTSTPQPKVDLTCPKAKKRLSPGVATRLPMMHAGEAREIKKPTSLYTIPSLRGDLSLTRPFAVTPALGGLWLLAPRSVACDAVREFPDVESNRLRVT